MLRGEDVTYFEQNEYVYMEEINEGVLKNLPIHKERKEERFVLDVGCGYGALAEAMEKKGYIVWGIESNQEAFSIARNRITRVIPEDLANFAAIKNILGERQFDYLVFSDVLEHLRDPTLILRSYLFFLKNTGKVIVSVPNVAAWNIRLKLFFGIFEYADSGILDRTHLRFFTFKTAEKMLKESGLKITKKDFTPYLLRSFLPIIKRTFLKSGKDRIDSRREILDSRPYRFYLRWIYPIEHLFGRVSRSLFAFRIIIVGERYG